MPDPTVTEAPRITCLGKIVILLFVLGCLAGGGWLLLRDRLGAANGPSSPNLGKDTAPPPAGTNPTAA